MAVMAFSRFLFGTPPCAKWIKRSLSVAALLPPNHAIAQAEKQCKTLSPAIPCLPSALSAVKGLLCNCFRLKVCVCLMWASASYIILWKRFGSAISSRHPTPVPAFLASYSPVLVFCGASAIIRISAGTPCAGKALLFGAFFKYLIIASKSSSSTGVYSRRSS